MSMRCQRVVADDSQTVVPVGRCGIVQGKLVVRDQVRPLLRLGEMLEADHRDLREPELAGRE